MKLSRSLLAITALSFLAFGAHAQWQWIDKAGHKVFSDLPPPSDVPEKNILKRPGARSFSAGGADSAPTAAPAPQPGVDKALEEKKKQAEAAEATRRKVEEDRNAQIRAENCARAQQSKAGLDAGGRMARLNDKGEREFMDDAAIASEQQRLQQLIIENCR